MRGQRARAQGALLSPTVAQQPSGHIIWMWSIEIVRRDLRNRFTHEPDPWVALDATDGAR